MPQPDAAGERTADGREEVREAKVASVDGLLFPHARQVVRIHRKRHRLGTTKWSTETVYAATDLAAHQAGPAEIAAWARGHWMIESTVHWPKDVIFGEDLSQVRHHHTPAAMSVFRDLARAAISIASAGPTSPAADALTPDPNPSSLSHDQNRRTRLSPGLWGTPCCELASRTNIAGRPLG